MSKLLFTNTKKSLPKGSWILALILTGASSAFAADTATTDRKDVSFMKEAAQGGQSEVEMGKLANDKAQNSQVKQLGERLYQDHSKANQELMQIAQKSGVTLNAEPTHKEAKMEQKIQDKAGAEFDKAFVEHALNDHEKDIRKFQKASQDVHNPELKAWIDKNLPVLRKHLELARSAGAAVGVDQKALNAADRFLANYPDAGGKWSPTSPTRSTETPNSSVGNAPGNQSGQGSNSDTKDSRHDSTPVK